MGSFVIIDGEHSQEHDRYPIATTALNCGHNKALQGRKRAIDQLYMTLCVCVCADILYVGESLALWHSGAFSMSAGLFGRGLEFHTPTR